MHDAFPDDWQPLPPAARTVAGLVGALAWAAPGVGLCVLASGVLPDGLAWRVPAWLAILATMAGLGLALGRARWRRTGWRLDARGLQVRRGLLWRSEVLVPRTRVQHLDIERGPIERRFGLATLVVHTAGTRLHALRQSGFPDADAVAIRDALLPEAGRHGDAL